MALIWADGFDHYGTDSVTVRENMVKGPYLRASGITLVTGGNARTGAYALAFPNNNGCYFEKIFPGQTPPLTVGWGMAVNVVTPQNVGGIFGWNWRAANGAIQVSAYFETDGSVGVRRGGYNGPLLGKLESNTIVPGSYSFVEWRVFSDSANGSIECRVNNRQVLLLTGINTNPANQAGINSILFGDNDNHGGQMGIYVDDLVLWDTLGAYNNDFMGDARCRTMLPTANGSLQEWGAKVAPAFGEVSRVPPDPLNHNISSDTAGQRSTFSVSQLPTNTAYSAGVVMFTYASKSDAGVCEIVPALKSGATVAPGNIISPGTSAAYYPSIFDVDPNTGSTWTLAALQALQVQVTRQA